MTEDFNFSKWIQLPETYLPMATLSETSPKTPRFNTVWRVTSNAELWQVIENINQLMDDSGLKYPRTLWFRGLSKATYALLPSLLRSYFKRNKNCSLPQYQRMFLEKFLARSSSTPEIGGVTQYKLGNGQIEHIADMQHYGVPTNLLDWSEDISIPLYFSTKNKSVHEASAIYVLHPYFYNFVRNEIIKQFGKPTPGDAGNPSAEQRNLDTTDTCIGGLLPNFSTPFNLSAARYRDFVVGPDIWPGLTEDHKQRKHDPLSSTGIVNYPAPLLPLAILVPRNNVRIQKQSGTFLAFNLCEFPQKPEKGKTLKDDMLHGFYHVALDRVQKFYMLNDELRRRIDLMPDTPAYRAMKDGYPFLFKIEIAPSAMPALNQVAATLGKRKDTVYPELYNIGEQIESEDESW